MVVIISLEYSYLHSCSNNDLGIHLTVWNSETSLQIAGSIPLGLVYLSQIDGRY